MRLLIVDDDAPFAHMLADQLEKLEPSFDVETAPSAAVARQAVQTATIPFDAFLLDHRLDGSDVDGVTLMGELLQASPDSGAVICTGYDDSETKQAASSAGAYWYLSKPFQTWDVVHILRQLHDRNRLKTLNQIATEMQEAAIVHDVADAIVRGALRFGFQRARLRLFAQEGQEANDDPEMIGMSQAGSPHIEGFEGLRTPLTRLLYSQRAIQAGKPLFFKGRELGPGGADEFYAAHSAQPPMGDWVKIPLLSGAYRIGTLTLDNADQNCAFEPQQRSQLTLVLGLFGKQAAAALERARLHEQTSRQAEEAETLSAIGRRITTEAAKGKLDDLLDEVRRQVGSLMDVTNFMVVLLDLETSALDFRRQYEEAALHDRHWRASDAGLSGYVITHNKAVLTDDTETFRSKHGIAPYGYRAECWLGVPLEVDGRAAGALVVQSYQDKAVYTESHKRLLLLVAEQVAGAIHMAYQLKRKAELDQQDRALSDLRRVMQRLMEESEDSFWHAVLTTITHREGNSFNRAALFWYDETGIQMQGRMGIGYFCREDARRAWEQDEIEGGTLQQYLSAPHLARMRATPLQQETFGWRCESGAPTGLCHQVWIDGCRRVTSPAALRGYLPAELLNPPDLLNDEKEYTCALMPVQVGGKARGLLVVDNAFDGEPLRPKDLDKLDTLLTEAMQVWLKSRETSQAQQLGESYEQILTLDHRMTAQAAEQTLKQILDGLCEDAKALTGADCVVIYPFHSSRGGYELSLVSYAGLDEPEEFEARTKDKPRQHGVTFTILQSGVLVVPDVGDKDHYEHTFAGRRLAEHAFLLREQIKALIGVPMRQAATGESLGVIYLDYRKARKFSELDVACAEHIAAIGAKVISIRRQIERQEQGLAKAEQSEQQRRRDMEFLGNVQRQALAADSDEKKVIRSILQNATELFGRSVTITLALLTWEPQGEDTQQVRRDYRVSESGRLNSRRSSIEKTPIGESLLRNELYHSQNALVVPVRLDEKIIAALMVRKLAKRAIFDDVEQEIAERLATVTALALDNVRTRAHLETVSKTIGAVSDKRGLIDTLDAVVHMARRVAPEIDCVTLWYEDRETGKLIPGPQGGVKNKKHKGANLQTDRLVRAVMQRYAPVFASTVEREPLLHGDFTCDEGIASTAAFPLRFGEKQDSFGALFLNYRKAHEFSPMERTLFPIFANAAATAIHSAQTIELAERRRKRLETSLAVATQAGASLDMDTVLWQVLTILRNEFRRNLGDDTAPYIMLYDDQDRVLELPMIARKFYQPDLPEYQDRVRLLLDGTGITTRTAREAKADGKIIVTNMKDARDKQAYPDYVEVNSKTRSEMCAGLVSNNRLLGALVIKSANPGAFNIEDEKLFKMAAHQVAIALDRLERAATEQRHALVTGAMAWAADIAHDINSDVGYIRNRASWLRDRRDELATKGERWAKEIDERAEKLNDLVRGARLRRNDPTPFALMDMFRSRITLWCEENAPNVQVLLPDQEILSSQVSVHEEQTWSAIRHLLRNAVEAMEEAGSLQLMITLRLLPVGSNQIELQIEDTGPGIPDEGRRRIFRELYSTKDREDRGYGLSIAQSLIESMNGRIYLYPAAPGRGALFGIRLPLTNQE